MNTVSVPTESIPLQRPLLQILQDKDALELSHKLEHGIETLESIKRDMAELRTKYDVKNAVSQWWSQEEQPQLMLDRESIGKSYAVGIPINHFPFQRPPHEVLQHKDAQDLILKLKNGSATLLSMEQDMAELRKKYDIKNAVIQSRSQKKPKLMLDRESIGKINTVGIPIKELPFRRPLHAALQDERKPGSTSESQVGDANPESMEQNMVKLRTGCDLNNAVSQQCSQKTQPSSLHYAELEPKEITNNIEPKKLDESTEYSSIDAMKTASFQKIRKIRQEMYENEKK